MARYRFAAEVNCGLDVLIEAPDFATAMDGAARAMIEHVADTAWSGSGSCIGVDVHEVTAFDDPPDTVYRLDARAGSVLMSEDNIDEET